MYKKMEFIVERSKEEPPCIWYCLGCLSAFLTSELETTAESPVKPLCPNCPNCKTALKREDIK